MAEQARLPEQFGRYRILSKLGEGGMGVVYLAQDGQLGRQVALKVPSFSAADGPAIQRFQREARIAASIDHPNLCAVFEVGEVDGLHYFTMPYVEGTPLSRLIRPEKPWPPRAAAELLRHVALALAVLHQKGIIHRDLKPGNIMVRKTGEPVLMDFGLARSYAAQSRQLTRMGSPLGTPAYMSPEQVEGDPRTIGPASDVYGLGVILYEMVTGQVPFEGPLMAVFAQILHSAPERPGALRAGLDADIEALCLKALAKKPAERFASMSALAAALVRYSRPVAVVADSTAIAPLMEAPPLLETSPTEGGRSVRPKKVPTPTELPIRRETESSGSGETTTTPSARRSWRRGGLLTVVVLLALLPIVWLLRGSKTEAPSPPPSPSLRLVAVAEVTVAAGQRRTVNVEVERQDCAGPIELRLAEASPDVVVRSGVVGADGKAGSLEVAVEVGAAAGERTLRLLAIAGSTRTEGVLRLTIRPPEQKAPPAASSLRLLPLDNVTLEAGKSLTVKVTVERQLCEGPIELRLADPVAGVTIRSGLVAAGSNTGQMELTAEAGAAAGERTLRVLAIAGSARTEGRLRVTIRTTGLAREVENKLKMKLVLIPAGTFKMGSPKGDQSAFDDEKVQHEVKITRPFYMGTTEVTVGQFKEFVRDVPYKTEAESDGKGCYGYDAVSGKFQLNKDYNWLKPGFDQTDDHPVVNVSWNDAVKFCEWLSRKEGMTYELPTEAEWEYACRAKTTTRYWCGDDEEELAKVGNVADASAKSKFPNWTTIKADDGYVFTAPVGKFRKNPFGLFDMHGNVLEWCADGPRVYPKEKTKDIIKDPKGPVDGDRRVLRGGSWYNLPRYCRSANRNDGDRGGRNNLIGFRVVLRPAARTP